jgi:hypothetical protein
MKKKDFQELRVRDRFDEDIGEFDSLVILPTRKKHDSGWMCMDFVACKDSEPICRLSGCSDVLNIDGIGGYGPYYGSINKSVVPKGWSIDCLPCGYLRLWSNHTLKVGVAVSNFELLGVSPRNKRQN